MKRKILYFVIIFSAFFSNNSKAQFITLTDSYFRDLLLSEGLSGCINGMQLDTTCPTLSTITYLSDENVSGIRNTYGIKYLNNLESLELNSAWLDSLSELPSTLKYLDCDLSHLSVFPQLPQGILSFSAKFNRMTTLPTIPSSLKILDISSGLITGTINLPVNLETANCNNNSFTSIDSIPSTLLSLDIGRNQINSLPNLPSSLESLNVGSNQLNSLPSLPPGLKYLECGNNPMTSPLPALPASLESLGASQCNLTVTPVLGPNLITISLQYNQLTSISSFPVSTTSINVSGNLLTTLPNIPGNVRSLSIRNNLLTALPIIPDTLQNLFFDHNQITTLDSLPKICQLIDGSYNQISVIPNIPSNCRLTFSHNLITTIPPLKRETPMFLSYNLIQNLTLLDATLNVLFIDHNPIACLLLIRKCDSLRIGNTNIHCLPFRIPSAYGNDVNLDTFLLCQPSNGCPVYWNIVGEVYLDANSNCASDSNETELKNVPVQLDSSGTTLQICNTDINGQYSFRAALGTYEVQIDTSNLPFSVNCPGGNIQTIDLTPADSLIDSLNFVLECRNFSDLAAISVTPQNSFTPGNYQTIYLNVGSASSNYGALCLNDSGIVYAVLSGPVNYVIPAPGALIPTVNGDTLLWNIQDFSSIDPQTSFNFIVLTDTTAQMNDTVCIQMFVNSINDPNNYNDFINDCFLVRTSYDPNEKWISPLEADTTMHDFTFTVLFQNTGNAPAQNIYILDTLENDLDASTFQFISSSHDAVTQLLPGSILRFNYHAINLPDSINDEPNSHGFVKFSVRRKPTTGLGTEISNTASIFFDYNEPVITNTVSLTINGQVYSEELLVNPDEITIYPNPAKSFFKFNIEQNSAVERISIYSMDGTEVLRTYQPNSNSINIEKFQNGIYTVALFFDNTIINKKLIVFK